MARRPTPRKTSTAFRDSDLAGLIVDAMPCAYALFDDRDRLILFNADYRGYTGLDVKFLSGHPTFEEILREIMARGRIYAARENPEAWLKRHLDYRRNPEGSMEVSDEKGRLLRIDEQRHENGYTSVRFEDISELSSQQRSIQERDERVRIIESQLRAAIESISDGFAMFDTHGRLVLCNSAYVININGVAQEFTPGQTYDSILRACAAVAFDPAQKKEMLRWKKWRLSRLKNPGPPVDYRYPNGVWRRYNDFVTADGNHVVLASDISALKKMTGDLARREEHLRVIMETVLDAIITIDKKGAIDTFNPAAERIFGFTAEEVIGKNVKKLMPQPYRQEHDGYLARYLETGADRIVGVGREVVGRRKGGSTFPMELAVSEGQHAGEIMFIGAIRDITKRKAAEQALKLSEERFALAMKASNEGIWDWDIETNMVHVSPRIEQLLKIEDNSRVSKNFLYKTMHPDDRKAYKTAIVAHLKGQSAAFEYEYRHLDKDGNIYWLYSRAIALRRPGGRAYRMIGSLGDISKRKRDEEALRDALAQAKVANRSKTEFLANISHELRTPLNAIIGFSDLIGSEIFGPVGVGKYLEYAKTISESGHHLLDIINDILDVARIEVGKLDFKPERVELEPIFETCLRLIRERADKGGLTLRRNIQGGLPDIKGDPRRLKQILLNLLSNAVKFTPREGTVTLRARTTTAGTLVISVNDTGIGIKAADIPGAMTPFVQIDSKLSRSYEGTGLGLPLTKSFVELHGGELVIRSSPGKGATVTIYFPKSIQLRRRR